ncbi:MAG: Spo0E like sporulation regulatory protein [Firmicutes bacterium]|nr:Spo0E like sporulation regulatory protein [Bacillota bacterium]
MAELKEILNIIEGLREKLGKMSKEKALTDPEVVSASQMLDAVLNEYQKLMKEKTGRS